MALRWLSWNDLPQSANAEGGYGITSEGQPCAWDDPKCRYSAIIDLKWFETTGDEEYALETCVIRDYKSDWPADESYLDSLQQRGQAVIAYEHHGDTVQCIRLEIVNLRTGRTYDRTIMLDDDNIAMLQQWKADIFMLCDAMDKTREPRPGAGCLDCNYTLGCSHCLNYYRDNGQDAAISYATCTAVAEGLAKVLRAKSKDHKFHIPGGYVGYKISQIKTLTNTALKAVTEHWYGGDDTDLALVRGLLMAGDITPTNIEKIAKSLYPGKDDAGRQDLLEAAITTIPDKRFGVHKA